MFGSFRVPALIPPQEGTMKRLLAVILLGVAVVAIAMLTDASSAVTGANAPQYSADGKMLRPNYRQWVFLSSGLGMNYNPQTGGPDHPMFTNVYASPEAYNSFLQTGRWPDKTILVLEVYEAATIGSINKAGHYQDTLMAVEAHVKDTTRGGDVWKFYGFGANLASAGAMPDGNPCTQCHTQHGAVDHTFVQFYPTLLEVARKKGTLKPGVDTSARDGK